MTIDGGGGSGTVQEVDNCRKLASLGDFSGNAWSVESKRGLGTCAALFTYNGKFAILTIDVNR